MKVNLTIAVTIETDKLDAATKEAAVGDCEMTAFPATAENIAWYLVEQICLDNSEPGVRMELVP